MSEHPTQPRSRLLRLLAIVWVAFISGFVVVDRVAISRLTQRVDASIDHLVVRSLEEKVAALEQQLQAAQREPRPVSQEAFTGVQQALDERLAKIEQTVRDATSANDLLPLKERLSTIETRLARIATVRPTTATRPPAAPTTEPTPPDPPFTVLGIEWRSGKYFLSLAPAGAYSLDAVRVLQPGESYEDWQLESLDGEAAVFRVAGRSQRVTVR